MCQTCDFYSLMEAEIRTLDDYEVFQFVSTFLGVDLSDQPNLTKTILTQLYKRMKFYKSNYTVVKELVDMFGRGLRPKISLYTAIAIVKNKYEPAIKTMLESINLYTLLNYYMVVAIVKNDCFVALDYLLDCVPDRQERQRIFDYKDVAYIVFTQCSYRMIQRLSMEVYPQEFVDAYL